MITTTMKDLRGRVRPASRSQISEAYWLSEDSVESIAARYQCTSAQVRALAGPAEVIGPPCPVCGQPFVAQTRTEALDLVHAPATSATWQQGTVPVCCGPAVIWYYPLDDGEHAMGEPGGGAIGARWRELNAQWKRSRLTD